MATTPRLNMRRPAGGDAFTVHTDLQSIVDPLDNAAIDQQGTLTARPAANAVPSGTYYFATDTGVAYRSDGTSWHVVGVRPGNGIALDELPNHLPGMRVAGGYDDTTIDDSTTSSAWADSDLSITIENTDASNYEIEIEAHLPTAGIVATGAELIAQFRIYNLTDAVELAVARLELNLDDVTWEHFAPVVMKGILSGGGAKTIKVQGRHMAATGTVYFNKPYIDSSKAMLQAKWVR